MTRLVIRGEEFYELNLQFDNSLDLHSEGGIQLGIFHRNGQHPYRRYVPEYINSGFGPQFVVRELSIDAETPDFNCKLSQVLQYINAHFTKGEETQILLTCCLVIPSQWKTSNSQLTPNTLRNMDRAALNKQRTLTIKYSPELIYATKSNTRSLHYPKIFLMKLILLENGMNYLIKIKKTRTNIQISYNFEPNVTNSNKWNVLKQITWFRQNFALSHPYLKKSLINSSPNDFNKNELNLLKNWNPNLHKGVKYLQKNKYLLKFFQVKSVLFIKVRVVENITLKIKKVYIK